MNIVYVAKHNSGDNDDEGAIAHALGQLGHTVVLIQEKEGHKALDYKGWADFLLFHKWRDYKTLSVLAKHGVACAFWYFDLVDSNDALLGNRSADRINWMGSVIPHCVAGFCTDGDWVLRDKTGKLFHLMQGVDERTAGYGVPYTETVVVPPIIFTGSIRHGLVRENHIKRLSSVFGKDFGVVGNGGPQDRLHKKDLADLFASTKIVIAPDGPSTDNYWSNRVYLTLGHGGFLLHPFCARLADHYNPDELVMYHTRAELEGLIRLYLENPVKRMTIRENGLNKTMTHHTYRHRCVDLLKIMARCI